MSYSQESLSEYTMNGTKVGSDSLIQNCSGNLCVCSGQAAEQHRWPHILLQCHLILWGSSDTTRLSSP